MEATSSPRRSNHTTPETPLFCTPDGTPWDEDNARKALLAVVVELASRRLVERGLPPLPKITPHSLRRTYVSIMLLATNYDIPFVQHQVGHAYAQMPHPLLPEIHDLQALYEG
jgi:integrase